MESASSPRTANFPQPPQIPNLDTIDPLAAKLAGIDWVTFGVSQDLLNELSSRIGLNPAILAGKGTLQPTAAVVAPVVAPYTSCPCCGWHNPANDYDSMTGIPVRRCVCGAVFGEMKLAQSYRVVKPQFHPEPDFEPGQTRYFDFSGLDPEGQPYRRHGWYDPETRLITQAG